MRPNSILAFERLFLGSIALSVLNFVMGYEALVETVDRHPTLVAAGIGSGAAVALFALGVAIYLLLWFLVARKAANWAKWVLVALLALSLLSLASSPGDAFALNLTALLGLVVYALQLAAAVFLFRADAIAWLKDTPPSDPAASG